MKVCRGDGDGVVSNGDGVVSGGDGVLSPPSPVRPLRCVALRCVVCGTKRVVDRVQSSPPLVLPALEEGI